MILSAAALLAAFCATACGSDDPVLPDPGPTPVAVTETFDGRLTINGGVTHPFAVDRIGAVTVRLAAVDPTDVTIGLSLGTWNTGANVCQVILRNDAAPGGATIVGTASVAGNFCVSVYDVGRLSQAILYTLEVSHF